MREMSRTEREKHFMLLLMWGIRKTNKPDEQANQNRNGLADTENKVTVARGERVGGTDGEVQGQREAPTPCYKVSEPQGRDTQPREHGR